MAGKSPTNIFGKEKIRVSEDDKLARWVRKTDPISVDWTKVSACTLRSVIAVCLAEGVHLTFAPAAGGIGVCIKVWNGGKDRKEYAMNAAETEDLLNWLIDALQSSSEDVRLIYATGAD